MDPKPDKCRRTDGIKWRCSKNVVLNEKYCERHMHRGHSRSSRKLVEPSQSTPNKTTCPDVQDGLDSKMEIFAKELQDELMKNDSDVEIDIMTVPTESQDLTDSEGSSLLEESDSDFENVDTLGKSEALSDFWTDIVSALDIDGFGDGSTHRRKKLTAHWRSFIQPIMWRCKWTELQIKKLQSLAQQYDRELEAQSKRKQIQLEGLTPIDGVKLVPFSRTNDVNDLAGRKKRRMTKATTDVAEYMSCHNLFSYYENKKSSTKGASMSDLPRISATQKVNSGDEFWANKDLLAFTAGDGANCSRDILWKIEFLRSQSGQLRSRVDTVIRENDDNISTADKLTLCNDGDRVNVGT